METERLKEFQAEIDRLRRRYMAAIRELSDAREVRASWAVQVNGLCWFVPLEDVVETDIDVEILGEVMIVRADRIWPEPAILVGILPVPRGFESEGVAIRFREQTLEVRVQRVGHRVAP